MVRYTVFLRGINVGRANRLAMADLRTLLTGEGYQNVATLLQSGHVVLAAPVSAADLTTAITQSPRQRFGRVIDVVVRTGEELWRVAAKDPLRDVAVDDSRYVVLFRSEPADQTLVETVAGTDFGPERCLIDGAEMYFWCLGGIRDSPILAALGKIPAPDAESRRVSTMRNWNTVRRLVMML
ncbi:MAG TPA: DUF1697 domain-containing protein [Jiangellales bacterium]|nr:DUF1697 domain-containing protein [Jiangellales bacterium]